MNTKIATIIGARPQFVKAAMVSRAIACHNKAINNQQSTFNEIIIHTGQHYDSNMSQVFFDELDIPRPAYNLGIGSGGHGVQTGAMLSAIEEVLVKEKPDWALVYGDTNSTLAGALAAAKLHIPIAHVEAGLRSFNMRMPEEVNRVLTDHVARLLFCPTRSAVENLRREGITRGAVHMGDVMYDAALSFGELAGQQSTIQSDLGLTPQKYCLATIHRAENTDDPGRLRGILEALAEIASPAMPLVLPLHPRTRDCIDHLGLASVVDKNLCVRIIEPVSFLDMVMLEKHALLIMTDSGGVQKEAYFHGVPCVTLRDETEWVETVEAGWNTVAGAAKDTILKAAANSRQGKPIPDYGNGHAAEAVVAGLAGFNAATETIPA
jgi:UDP-GlcNAc3NAcA epimerase